MAKRPQAWVQCEDRLPYYKDSSCSLPRPHDSTTREDLGGDARGPAICPKYARCSTVVTAVLRAIAGISLAEPDPLAGVYRQLSRCGKKQRAGVELGACCSAY